MQLVRKHSKESTRTIFIEIANLDQRQGREELQGLVGHQVQEELQGVAERPVLVEHQVDVGREEHLVHEELEAHQAELEVLAVRQELAGVWAQEVLLALEVGEAQVAHRVQGEHLRVQYCHV